MGNWGVVQVVVVVVVAGTLAEQQTLEVAEVVGNLHGVRGRRLGFLQAP